ncbi:DUF6894 family protein [Methylobacterium durans]|uniref:DUF6894 domain-containing protein n=1 Tax=Methylobacterium durans TaxID=2202825 RepID=A0A2U8W3W3_9HYPH|nr:hypothetical protein [Methylobacterium durans]AWN40759.1 hypothetical protein DK389_09760 [Methylobacterium durans]
MPWFYFHLRTPAGLERDDVGLDLIGIEAAYLDACRAIPTLTTELLAKKTDPWRCRFEIADAAVIVAMIAALTAASAIGTATASIDPGDEIAINAGM